MKTYYILRMFAPDESGMSKPPEVIETGLTLKEAQAHCQDESTSIPGQYFDGYESE